jgi:hypothetical protein
MAIVLKHFKLFSSLLFNSLTLFKSMVDTKRKEINPVIAIYNLTLKRFSLGLIRPKSFSGEKRLISFYCLKVGIFSKKKFTF